MHSHPYVGKNDVVRFEAAIGMPEHSCGARQPHASFEATLQRERGDASHRSLKRIPTALLLLCIYCSPVWGARVPTAVEFRAAYCHRIMQWSVQQMKSDRNMLEQELRARRRGDSLPARNAGFSDEALQDLLLRTQTEAADGHAGLEKLEQYLAPRTPDLESEALKAARQRADLDIQEIAELNSECGFRCAHGPDFEACLAEKCGGTDLLRRYRGCSNPSWLEN